MVGLPGVGVGGGGAVVMQRLAGLPADQAHERVIVAAGEAGVGTEADVGRGEPGELVEALPESRTGG